MLGEVFSSIAATICLDDLLHRAATPEVERLQIPAQQASNGTTIAPQANKAKQGSKIEVSPMIDLHGLRVVLMILLLRA